MKSMSSESSHVITVIKLLKFFYATTTFQDYCGDKLGIVFRELLIFYKLM